MTKYLILCYKISLEKIFDWIAYKPPKKGIGIFLWVLLSPLYFLSLIYWVAVKTRLFLYSADIIKAKKIGIKVVSVGNLTVGGTGKTPTVALVAAIMHQRGLRVVVVSRGYKRKEVDSTEVVSDGKDILLTPEMAGDEPYMLAKKLKNVPVVVGADRYGACLVAEKKFSPDLIILDDAFQHMRLHRDVNILLIDGEKWFGNGMLFPRGPLREPLSGLKRADMILVTKVHSQMPEKIRGIIRGNSDIPVYNSSYRAQGFVPLMKGDITGTEEFSGKKVAVISAIANPSSFTGLLSSLGAIIIFEESFRDHHHYKESELASFMDKAVNEGAEAVITTEKDAVKIAQLGEIDGLPICFLKISLDLAGKEESFIDLIMRKAGIEENEA